MKNIWRIFRSDWQRLTASVVAVVVVMGLCLIPCLYAWFNIFSNWDPYGPDSTSNIRVAVTSEDEGYELLGLKLNIGSMVLDGLKSNHQMGWDFVDSREEALEGVRSGKYYAALIVPSDFTGDFVSILDTDLRHPQIQYYENQKKNAIAPKITNKAKTAVQDEINATVVETVTDAVTTVSSVCKALGLDADDVSQGIIEKLGSAQQSLLALENTLTAMQTLVDQTDSILACAGVVSDDLNNIVKSGDLSGVQDALNRGVGRLNEAEARSPGSWRTSTTSWTSSPPTWPPPWERRRTWRTFWRALPSGWMSGWRSSSSGWRSCGTLPTTIPPSRSGWATPFTTSGSFGTC